MFRAWRDSIEEHTEQSRRKGCKVNEVLLPLLLFVLFAIINV